MSASAARPLGLIAGNGQFPLLFAQAARRQGRPVVAVAMRGETPQALDDYVDDVTWVRVGQLRRMIRALQRGGVKQAAMAGGVRKTRLFGFAGARPDWLSLQILARCAVRRDDGLLRAVAAEFERAGISIVDSTLLMPEVLAARGVLTRSQPSADEWRDLRYGARVAHRMGWLDIGQTVVVKDGAVVALEAIEGTDACIRRAGELTGGRGAVVVKTAKPGQDMRFDVPAVGLATLDSMRAAGVRVLGIEAGRTLMLQAQALLAAADDRQMTVVGLSPDMVGVVPDDEPANAHHDNNHGDGEAVLTGGAKG